METMAQQAPVVKPDPRAHPSGDKRFKMLDAAMKRHQFESDALLEILHQAQELFGFLSDDVLIYVGRALKAPLSRVYGVATFYNFFTLKPKGAHTCTVCLGTACYVKGASEILDGLRKAYDVKPGETTRDGQLSVVVARCVGACGIAPAVAFDSDVHGKQTKASVLARV
ncbi:MAG TPA: bidirectional hydrogenase complex protein HoxE, partial [Anaeromyxobacteraceae bacterium]|nr:bidirectional hydrogenase complex protein HoxE [Anaeromyxobacteraceae bacterium]